MNYFTWQLYVFDNRRGEKVDEISNPPRDLHSTSWPISSLNWNALQALFKCKVNARVHLLAPKLWSMSKTTANLARLMPNIGGPKEAKEDWRQAWCTRSCFMQLRLVQVASKIMLSRKDCPWHREVQRWKLYLQDLNSTEILFQDKGLFIGLDSSMPT